MNETTTIDRDYLWALEVIACEHLDDRPDQNPDDLEHARRYVDRAVLRQPIRLDR